MLTLMVGAVEAFNDETQKFEMAGGTPIELEHSLVSLSKWESKFEKPFLGREQKTNEETLAYIRDMTLTPNVPPELYSRITNENLSTVNKYIAAKMTATWFNEPKGSPPAREVITSELIYYWLVALAIPFECQYWHLNRLFTLVKVINEKNKPAKKTRTNPRALADQRRQLNEQRKAALKTAG